LRKLDKGILSRQKENKNRIREALSQIDQITFRTILDPEGDTATFLIFFLPTAEKAKAFNRAMAEEGAGTVYWYDNLWHYFERWEHLLEGKTLFRNGYPFKTESGENRLSYTSSSLPKTAELLSRALTIPISINMEVEIPRILKAIEKAAKIL
jgi:8-amino-3,8-dideoxy-alpha-D-manno-octulosonate transaminase